MFVGSGQTACCVAGAQSERLADILYMRQLMSLLRVQQAPCGGLGADT